MISEQIGKRAGMTTPVVELTQLRMPEVAAKIGVALFGPMRLVRKSEIRLRSLSTACQMSGIPFWIISPSARRNF